MKTKLKFKTQNIPPEKNQEFILNICRAIESLGEIFFPEKKFLFNLTGMFLDNEPPNVEAFSTGNCPLQPIKKFLDINKNASKEQRDRDFVLALVNLATELKSMPKEKAENLKKEVMDIYKKQMN